MNLKSSAIIVIQIISLSIALIGCVEQNKESSEHDVASSTNLARKLQPLNSSEFTGFAFGVDSLFHDVERIVMVNGFRAERNKLDAYSTKEDIQRLQDKYLQILINVCDSIYGTIDTHFVLIDSIQEVFYGVSGGEAVWVNLKPRLEWMLIPRHDIKLFSALGGRLLSTEINLPSSVTGFRTDTVPSYEPAGLSGTSRRRNTSWYRKLVPHTISFQMNRDTARQIDVVNRRGKIVTLGHIYGLRQNYKVTSGPRKDAKGTVYLPVMTSILTLWVEGTDSIFIQSGDELKSRGLR